MTASSLPAIPEHELASIVQAYHDVTERLKKSHEALAREVCRLRQELQAKNRELERRERLAALGEMAAGVAHEIRNPLGGIGLYASLLERDLHDRPHECDIARRMSVGVRNLESIVSDILAFAGDATPSPQTVPAGRIIDGAVTQVAPKAEALGVRLDIDPGPPALLLQCDPAQIGRAIINLLLNAFDAAGAGGSVWLRAQPAPGQPDLARITVEDNGPGIAPDVLHRIFDPFFSTKDTGTGLGLAIVHRIAELSGGSITAGNRDAGGAAFVLALPAVCDHPERSEGEQ